jgi:two-component system, NtrC family, response regulator
LLLLIDDDIAIQASLALLFQQEGFKLLSVNSPQEAMAFLATQQPELVILDMNFSVETSGLEGLSTLRKIKTLYPRLPVILLTGWGTIELAVEGMKIGAADFLTKPWQNDVLLQSVRTALNLAQTPLQTPNRKRLNEQFNFENIVGEAPQLLELLESIGRVAPTDAPVLITGESGTGKELIAEAVHLNSKRGKAPFVKVNLGGISASLFESELFGHVRGAFTDAKTDRIGRFEMAHKGSIFLDEIGDLDLSSQVKLLRVLQDRSFEPLGSSRSKTVDVRIVCATNRNLEEMVAQGTFREDLFYRINLITVKLPALRERGRDIPTLVNFFVNNLKVLYSRPQLQIQKEALHWLQNLPLPGNIRQLKNLVERTVLLSTGDELSVADFQKNVQTFSPGTKSSAKFPEVGSMTLEEMELEMIKRALAFHQNKLSKVARSLGITRFALYRRLEKYGIAFEEGEE